MADEQQQPGGTHDDAMPVAGDVSQDDLDRLFEEQTDAGATGEATSALAHFAGGGTAALEALGRQAGDLLAVGLESVAGAQTQAGGARVDATDVAGLAAAFVGDYLAFEVRLALNEAESHAVAAILALDDVGRLMGTDTGREAMADATFAANQIGTIESGARELFDLISLTLFTDALTGTEATVAAVRRGDIEATLAGLDATGGPLLRVDFALALAAGEPVAVTLAVPGALAGRLAALLTGDEPAEVATAAAEDGADLAAEAADEAYIDDGLAAFEGAAARGSAAGPRDAGDIDEPAMREPTPLRAGTAEDYVQPAVEAVSASRGFGFGTGNGIGNGITNGGRPAATFGGDGRASGGDGVDVHPVRFPTLQETQPGMGNGLGNGAGNGAMDLIMDVQMRITVELGRSSMTVEEVLALGPGSVVELNKLAGEPVDILVNDHLIARGEVVVVDENFGVRVTEIVSPRRRAHAMGR